MENFLIRKPVIYILVHFGEKREHAEIYANWLIAALKSDDVRASLWQFLSSVLEKKGLK
jgi:hypothetical protein